MNASRAMCVLGLLAALVGRSALAGDQLTPALLLKQSVAVAVVDNPLSSSRAVRRWLTAEPTKPVELASPLCVPDRDMLKSWAKTHPTHEGAPVWARTIAVAHIDQVVFFAERKGRLVPFCETEVLQGRSFSTHPDYKAYLAEVEGLIAAANPVADAVVAEVAPVDVVVEAPVAPVVVDKGCW